jgi:hypothetical protein
MSTAKLTLAMFGVVPTSANPVPDKVAVDFEHGIVIEQAACWAKKDILSFVADSRLDGVALNKTWHKSWAEVTSSGESVNVTAKLMGFINSLGEKFNPSILIPNEVIGLADINMTLTTVRAQSNQEIADRAIQMLQSGIALKSGTISDLFDILDRTGYVFTGKEKIKNKEAIVMLADLHDIYPTDPVDSLRFAVYKATGSAMLIKSQSVITQIKESDYHPQVAFDACGAEKLAEIFNRFKPLFLAFKCKATKKLINRISKLSKTKHKPLPANALLEVTARKLVCEDLHWLHNATVFALFRALTACHTRMGGRTVFAYHIRNGKGWYKTASSKANNTDLNYNFELILHELKCRITAGDAKVFIPKGIRYALPTSEKMFVDNIPTGTKFTAQSIAAGIYWENEWGASDLDLSTIDVLGGKVGWNSGYTGQSQSLKYSGDITDAPNGATEFTQASSKLKHPSILLNNVYSGNDDCRYKIILGKGANITYKMMMATSDVWVEANAQSIKTETILGLFLPEKDDNVSFVILNTAIGNASVSGGNEHTLQFNKALVEQYTDQFSLNDLLEYVGFELTDSAQECTIDLSLNELERDTFTKLFS